MLNFLTVIAILAAFAMLINMAIPDGTFERRRLAHNRRELDRLYAKNSSYDRA